MTITLQPLEILERHADILRLVDLSFEEKVGYITGREAGDNTPPERLPQLAGAIRNILLGNQSRVLKEYATRAAATPIYPLKPKGPAKEFMTRSQAERELDEINKKMKSVDFSDQYAADNLQLWGKRIEVLKRRLAEC